MKRTKQNGITLIALVITIIVLLILAGVSIATLTGENGILTRANDARENTEKAEEDELRRLTALEAATNLEDTTHTDNSTGKEITVTIPAGFALSQVEGEDTIANGLVIIDSNLNEFVWIEVPKDISVYSSAGLSITDFTTSEYEKIENDLFEYTIDYKTNNDGSGMTTFSDSYYSADSIDLTDTQYIIQKHNMLKSIYQNGGFWVGRYEAGTNNNRISHTDITDITPLSQANLYPITYVTRAEANKLASKIMQSSNNYTSSIMFGIQYDLILKYFENHGTSIEELIRDSTNWGNYYNSSFTINRGSYAQYGNLELWYNYSENLENCAVNRIKLPSEIKDYGILLTTGSSEKNKKNNIYDFAGNVWEWTLETRNSDAYPCYRGGGYNDNGNSSVFYRIPHYFDGNNHNIGFRVTIY